MGSLRLASGTQLPTPWPAHAIFGIDFLTQRAMRDGIYIPLGQAMSFSRASSRLAKSAGGLWRSFAANEPALTEFGLSLEPEATNIIVNNTGNSGAGLLLVGTSMAPIGGDDSPARDGHGKRVTQGVGSTDGLTRHSLGTLGGQVYTWSQSFKYDGSAIWVRFTYSDNVANGINVWLNLQTMTLASAGIFGSAVLQAYGVTAEADGWARLHVTGTVPNNANGGLSIYVVAGNASSSRVAGTYGLWGPQMEMGAASSPIVGSSQTRAADMQSIILPAVSQTLSMLNAAGLATDMSTAGGTLTLPNTPAWTARALWSCPA